METIRVTDLMEKFCAIAKTAIIVFILCGAVFVKFELTVGVIYVLFLMAVAYYIAHGGNQNAPSRQRRGRKNETKALIDDGNELKGFKRGLVLIAAIVVAVIIAAVICFYFFWEMSAVGAIILLAEILWFRRDEVKKKVSLCLGAFLKQPVEIVLLGLFLGVAMATVTTIWIRYLVAFVFFIIALALYKSYKREQYEKRLSEKIIMEREQDGYSD